MEQSFQMGKNTVEQLVTLDAVDTLLYFEFNDRFKDHIESHAAWEMIYADRGRCTVVAGERSFVLEQGELYFHKPFEPHMLEIPKGEFPNILICSFQCASPILLHLGERRMRADTEIKQHISAIIHEAIQTFDLSNKRLLIQGILFRSKNHLPGGEQSIFLRLELMLIELLRKYALQSEQKSRFLTAELAADPLCCSIIAYLEEHICENPDMGAICEHVSFSRSYVSRHFSKVCGMPLSQYFNKMKMEEAKRLIRETRFSFTEISERLMLANSHYFSTLFKKYVGMSPTEYKQSCK